MIPDRIVVGSRPSKLSQAQTTMVVKLLKQTSPGVIVDISLVKTRGDRLPPERRSLTDGKRAFTGELEKMLLKNEIDIAVHSMKDLPSRLTSGLTIGATPPRGDPRDALLSNNRRTIRTLPLGARVGTSSLRRKAQLLRAREDLEVVPLHGNVDTRITKMVSNLDAVVLAVAGLRRLGEEKRISQIFSINQMVPAVGQGMIAVQMKKKDTRMARILSKIDDSLARAESSCERAFIERLGGDCYVPVGGCARASTGSIRFVGLIATPDGKKIVKKSLRSIPAEAASLGRRLAGELLEMGGEKILRKSAS
jgi:hydroxymethylbilane synthase